MLPTYQALRESELRIRPYIHRTPVMTSKAISQIAGCELFFKCENFQKMGAFKFRGAMNAILQLNESDKKRGVITHSSGNFGQAVALAAGISGIKSYIVMPENASEFKKKAVAGYGAEIYECDRSVSAREEKTNELIKKTGAILLHPYDQLEVILGQGTACSEFLEETPGLENIIVPVGGGGLIAGTALAARHISPETEIIGGEPFAADDAFRSLKTGIIQPSVNPVTIADGLLTSLGKLNFPIIQKLVKEIIRVEEKEIISAMRMVWERMKIIIEPSSAVALAALLREKSKFTNSKTGIIISGGNVDFDNLPF